MFIPHGTSRDGLDWQGAHLVNNIDLKAIFVQPTFSIRIGDEFSFGGGPIYATGSVNFQRDLLNPLLSAN